jgi:microcin C transport system substrate-binding protein
MTRWTAGVPCLALALGLAAALVPAAASATDTPPKRHAMSLVGEPAYGPDFKHFRWVNPDAPKGGRIRLYDEGSFDSLNVFPVQGEKAPGLGLLYDQLFASSPDEAASEYGHVAQWASYPADYSWVTFGLNPQARFHDGKPITADDVIYSFETLRRVYPLYRSYYRDVEKAEKISETEVTFRFSTKNNRELPHIVSQLYVIPRHWWEGTGPDGSKRDINKSTLEPPLGSGPYRVKSVEPGRQITYERVKDWWAKDLPVNRGQWNFDEIQYLSFRERTAGFESFKVGQIDFWRETSAKNWATEFDFDAVKRGFVKRHELPYIRVAPMQSFVMNLRRKQFQDVRVRRALHLAYDFEWSNKNLFYDQYTRVGSYFDNSDFAAKGLPSGRELEILNEVRGQIPADVFTTEWKNPLNDSPEALRRNLSQASRLLTEAGYTPRSGVLTNAAGEALSLEILLANPAFDRVVQPYKATLERLGVRVSIRIVDSTQYQRRIENFDFDMVVGSFPQSESPGNEQREFWGSAAADRPGSRNTAGIKNPAIDTLVEKVIFAGDRAELVAATKALDRVLLWYFYVVPQWHSTVDRVATWNLFGRPETLPRRATSFQQVWWYDQMAADRLKALRGN